MKACKRIIRYPLSYLLALGALMLGSAAPDAQR